MDTITSSDGREKSIRDLIADLTSKVTDLLRKEIQLVKLELSSALAQIKTAAIALAAGAVAVFGGFLVLLGAAVLGLDRWVHNLALSGLIVGGGVVAIGAILLMAAVRFLRRDQTVSDRSLLAPVTPHLQESPSSGSSEDTWNSRPTKRPRAPSSARSSRTERRSTAP